MKKVALLVAPVLAHNWMKLPIASHNGNLAATAKPCPQATDNYVGVTVAPGASITTSWTQNHGGMHYIRMVPEADMALLETEAAAAGGTYVMSAVANDGTDTADITAPTTPGVYTLQYVWSGYRNCARITVDASGATGTGGNSTGTPGAGMDALANSNCVTYCDDIMAQCTGDNAQYTGTADCMQGCARIPQDGNDGDMTGNTLQCRWYHIHTEQYEAAAEHCPHAGLEGGDLAHCGGSTYAAGVTVESQVLDPSQMTAMQYKALLLTALQEGGFVDCMSVGTPVLSTDAQFKNYYTTTVTFLECPAGSSTHTEQSPESNAAALSSTAGAGPVCDYITTRSEGMMNTCDILDFNYDDSSDAVAISAFGLMGLALLA